MVTEDSIAACAKLIGIIEKKLQKPGFASEYYYSWRINNEPNIHKGNELLLGFLRSNLFMMKQYPDKKTNNTITVFIGTVGLGEQKVPMGTIDFYLDILEK